MVRGPLQEPRRSSHFSSWLGWQGLFARLPDCHRALHAHNILQSEFGESVAKLGVDAVGRVGQNNPAIHLRCHRCPDLVQSDLRLGLKLQPRPGTSVFSRRSASSAHSLGRYRR